MAKLATASVASPEDDIAAYHEINASKMALADKMARGKVAASLAAGVSEAGDPERTRWAKAYAKDYAEIARRRPERLAAEIRDAQDELESLLPFHAAAFEKYERALSRQTAEVAIALQPKQKILVKRIAGLLEQLSSAIAEARELQAELTRRAPLPTSAHLPCVTTEISNMSLGRYDTAASRWVARMKQIGILK